MISTNLVKQNEDGTATFQIGVNVQMWIGVYTEPVPGKPETYEDEKKAHTWNAEEFENLVNKAREKAAELQKDIFTSMGYEASGLSHQEVVTLLGAAPVEIEGLADKGYSAAEDLTFLYSELAELWDFIFEMECVFMP